MENVKGKILRSFVLYGKEVKADKQKFISCQAEINGKWYKIKFRQDCEKAPKKRGLYNITIDLNMCSVERGQLYTNAMGDRVRGTSTIWVGEIEEITPWTDEMYKAKAMNDLSEVFGDEF